MKDAPKTIYLQVCEENECDSEFSEHEGVTWCQDKINDSDIEYTRADIPQQCDSSATPRTWVGLTWHDVPNEWVGNVSFMEGAKWAEAQLKEKNNA